MVLPAKLIVHNSAYALDGGTTVLQATDEAGRDRALMLVQHRFLRADPSLSPLPGRLYFDGELVPTRSDLEAGLLSLLRAAEVRQSEKCHNQGERIQLSANAMILSEDVRQILARSPEDNIRAHLAAIVEFVESAAYLQFAEKVEQALDPKRYTVWVAWDAENRNRVAVRLGRVLGIGLQAARESLNSEAPLAKDVTALVVSELAARYSADRLALRVEPAFRWRLA